MKRALLVLTLVMVFALSATAMPLHPSVVNKMSPQQLQDWAQQSRILHDRGVDNPAAWRD